MISLDDAAATQPEGDARRRHLVYAERAGRLTMIVHTPTGASDAIQASPYLTILPSNSRHKLTFIADALRLARRVPDIDLITTQEPFLTGLIGMWLRARLRLPLLVQNHSYFFGNVAWLAEKPLRNRILSAIGTFVVKRADMYRTVNHKEAENYVAIGGDPQRVIALPLGTASAAFAAPVDANALTALRTKLELLPAHKVVLWVGYPVAFKRVPLLFKVFRCVGEAEPDARLLLVGDLAKSPEDLVVLARAEGIAERVIMPGAVLHDQLPFYYTLGDVYVHTSAYEGVPRVLFEASAAGLPLVGMQAVGVDEVIEDGVNGYLVPDGDIEQMAARIVALLHDLERAQSMGETARRIAFERYDSDRYAEQWVAVWERAVALGMRTW
jgi:glycosyltransferase involved in cell wall biosynthesis